MKYDITQVIEVVNQALVDHQWHASVAGTNDPTKLGQNLAGLIAVETQCSIKLLDHTDAPDTLGDVYMAHLEYLSTVDELEPSAIGYPRGTWFATQPFLSQDGRNRMYHPERSHVNCSFAQLLLKGLQGGEEALAELRKDTHQNHKWASALLQYVKARISQ